MGQRRYPGATPFTKDQARIFYGRNNDIRNLLTMVRVEPKVLLYSKSGLGKTSLLEAGVIPKLPKNYVAISIRFYTKIDTSRLQDEASSLIKKAPNSEIQIKEEFKVLSPVERVISTLENTISKLDELPETILDLLDTEEQKRRSLWYYFKKLQLASIANTKQDEEPKIYFLVFDQFEELFSYNKQEVNEFKQQFYELTEQNVPEHFAKLIAGARRNNREKFNRQALSELHKKMDVKSIFAIRSDRLSLLNKLSDKITDIQQVFYEIKPLNDNQAREAIVKPAEDTKPGFETSPYSFHPEAINKILSELTEKGKEKIETTQLQIVCHRIEEIAEAKKQAQKDGLHIVIEKHELPEFKNIFLDFYHDSINKIPENARLNARRLVEDELIRNKQRISLDQEICKDAEEYPNISDEVLKKLVDTHLLRSELNSFERYSYELSHDTLIEPILEEKSKYEFEQEKIALKKKQEVELEQLNKKQEEERKERAVETKRLKEEQERKDKERKKKLKIQKTITVIISFFSLISVGLGLWGFDNYCDATAKKNEAQKAEHKANASLINFINSQYQFYLSAGNNAKDKAEYDKAIDNYTTAKEKWVRFKTNSPIADTDSSCSIFLLITKLFTKNEAPDIEADSTSQKSKLSADEISEIKAIAESIQKIELISDSIKQIIAFAPTSHKMPQFTRDIQQLIDISDSIQNMVSLIDDLQNIARISDSLEKMTVKLAKLQSIIPIPDSIKLGTIVEKLQNSFLNNDSIQKTIDLINHIKDISVLAFDIQKMIRNTENIQITIARTDTALKMNTLRKNIALCESLKSKAGKIIALLGTAESLRINRKYIEAMNIIKDAYKLDPKYPGVGSKYVNTKAEAIRMYGKARDDFKEVGNLTKMNEAQSSLEKVEGDNIRKKKMKL